jgi:peptidoglycan/LPS O-acetylase OafA/YrhL
LAPLTATPRVSEPRKFDFIDTLRGLAILAVILVHFQGQVGPLSSWLQALMSAGARGVQLFYIASALTLCLSWEFRASRERHPIRNFYLRRAFRIIPMFYVAIAGYLLLYGLTPRYFAPNGVPWYYIPLTGLFLNGFHPEMITSVVPGGWSIVVEMTFYAIFPILVTHFRGVAALTVLLAVSLIVRFAWVRLVYRIFLPSYAPEQSHLVDALAELGFLSQFPVFVMGMLAFWCFRNADRSKTVVAAAAALLVAWLIALTVMNTPPAAILSMHVVMGAILALFALTLARYPVRLLVNPLLIWIGKLSFSMYLSHFAVIEGFGASGISARFPSGNGSAILHYLLVVAATATVSSICYRLIERPGIEAGRRLIDRLESAHRVAA